MLDQSKKSESNKIIYIQNWNSTPKINHDDPVYRKTIIRPQIRPFNGFDSQNYAIGNHRKLIDFQTSQLSESDKQFHCAVLAEMCDKLAVCWHCPNFITEDALYYLFEAHGWQCANTGKHHIPHKQELTIEFKLAVYRGGKLTIANCKPVYRAGWFGGYYRIGGKPAQVEMIA